LGFNAGLRARLWEGRPGQKLTFSGIGKTKLRQARPSGKNQFAGTYNTPEKSKSRKISGSGRVKFGNQMISRPKEFPRQGGSGSFLSARRNFGGGGKGMTNY
jgi:hypothetical protein